VNHQNRASFYPYFNPFWLEYRIAICKAHTFLAFLWPASMDWNFDENQSVFTKTGGGPVLSVYRKPGGQIWIFQNFEKMK
jgi:hypothetical protein